MSPSKSINLTTSRLLNSLKVFQSSLKNLNQILLAIDDNLHLIHTTPSSIVQETVSMQFSSNYVWVWLAAIIAVFYIGEGVNSNPVHHVTNLTNRAIDNTSPYVPGQRFSRKTGIPNNATKEEASNRDFFAFTEANFRASGTVERYEEWLKKVNVTLEVMPGEEKPTEWQQFATEFWQDRDFLCGPLNQGNCDNMPTRAQIMALYPNNRTEARFVYYVTQVYQELHHYNVLFQVSLLPQPTASKRLHKTSMC